jgi:3,4-dihydroxy 2-butanone 4-phosphate synthase/GTP cyclohydrolase II
MNFREFGIGAQILSHLGLHKIKVITNNPNPFHGLAGFGLEIVDWVPIKESPGPTR